jgi:asparagine synthase (glutamine-hydrolysing)
MCGIAGILITPKRSGHFDEARRIVDEALGLMVEKVGHRGPDDRGTVSLDIKGGGAIGLGHTRLAILDTSPAGHQPMADHQTGNWITYNGEIYNYRELRRWLDKEEGSWWSHSDTEVILRAYQKWGSDCLEHLRGMFAMAIWDAKSRELFLSRDRLGIKPLYYYANDGLFLFSSEVRALLATGLVSRGLDVTALGEYLAYQSVPAPRTLVKGIRALMPGSWLKIDLTGDIVKGCYWDPLERSSREATNVTGSESKLRVGELLRESVAMHLVSDVPVAAFLSGGIDSSAVAALMREAGQTPQTFSVVFSESEYDEARYARQVASLIRSEHTEIHLTEQDLIDQLPRALAAMDQPTGDGINTYIISSAVSAAGVKVALSGLGGDELFAGYSSFARLARTARYLKMWGRVPSLLRLVTARAVGTLGGNSVATTKTASILEGDGTIASVFPPLRQVLSPSQRRSLLTDELLSRIGYAKDPYTAALGDTLARYPGAGVLSQVSYAEARTYMHDVLLRDTDQMSMAHALEVRVPLLDHKLVEYVMGLADDHKRPNGTPKRLLVESLNGLLPPEVVHRPKQGFTLPFDLWMRGSMRAFCEERLSPDRISGRRILRSDQVQRLWQRFIDKRPDVTWSRLWILIALEEWLERNGIRCESC